MNALAPMPTGGLPACCPTAPMTPALRACVDGPIRYGAPGDPDAFVSTPPVPTRSDRIEARTVLGGFERACQPPDPSDPTWQADVVTWLARVASSVRNPPPRSDMLARAAAVATVCAALPRAVWTLETAGDAMKTFAWWPSAADVHGLLEGYAKPMLATLAGLRCVAAHEAAQANAENVKADPVQALADQLRSRARVRELVSTASAQLAELEPAAGQRATVNPSYLSDPALLVAWEKAAADGIPGAHIRATALRRRLGISGPVHGGAASDEPPVWEAER